MPNPFADKGGADDAPEKKNEGSKEQDPKAAKPPEGDKPKAEADVPDPKNPGEQDAAQKGATAMDVLGKAINIASQALVQAAQQIDANPELTDPTLAQQVKTVMVQVAQIAEAIGKVSSSPEKGMTPPEAETDNQQQPTSPA